MENLRDDQLPKTVILRLAISNVWENRGGADF